MGYDFGRNFVFNKAKAQVMKASGGHYPAPLKILEVILSFLEVIFWGFDCLRLWLLSNWRELTWEI